MFCDCSASIQQCCNILRRQLHKRSIRQILQLCVQSYVIKLLGNAIILSTKIMHNHLILVAAIIPYSINPLENAARILSSVTPSLAHFHHSHGLQSQNI